MELRGCAFTLGRPASADEFLSALIYSVLQANPPLLHSNLHFLHCFSLPIHLVSGETGYFFTSLCSATVYIQEMTAQGLRVSEDDFLTFTSQRIPPSLFDTDTFPGYLALKAMENTLAEWRSVDLKTKDCRSKELQTRTGRRLSFLLDEEVPMCEQNQSLLEMVDSLLQYIDSTNQSCGSGSRAVDT